jgi:transcriptional regulator with XRE-family HTH domain
MTDLGTALRTWRDRLSPSAVGLPDNGRRRSAGLRREELAMLAGVSADYVTRLEQGRAGNPSAQVIQALARALQLDNAERDHLFRLAGLPKPSAGQINAHLTPGVQRLLRRLDEFPVSVHDAAWNIVAWNHAWASLMGDPSPTTGRDRNLLWRHFTRGSRARADHESGTEPGSLVQRSAAETAEFELAAVGDLREAAGRYPQDAGLRSLISDLIAASPRFQQLWDEGVVGTHTADVKIINHPAMGRLEVDCDVFTVHGSDLRVIVYSAEPGSAAAEKLAMLRVIGLQAMPT